MKWRIVIALALLSIALIASPALSSKEKDTATIGWGESVDVKMNIDGSMNIKYDVEVTDGPNVNVWFLEKVDYDKYASGQPFNYFVLYSNENVRSISEDFTWSDSGNHYVVIDTMGLADLDENATVTYTVEWEKLSVGDWMANIGICLAIIIVVLIVGFFIRKARKKLTDQPVPPPMEQQPGYEYQQQQGYDQPPPRPSHVPPSDQGPGYVPQDPPAPPPQQPGAYDPTQKPPE